MSAAFTCKQREIKVKLWPRAKEKCGKITQAVSKRAKTTYRYNIPSEVIKAASFVHPEIAAAHWKLNSEAVILNIQGFPPSTSSSQACVRETPVVFLSATNPLGRTQMSVEFPTLSGAQSRLSCCEARGLRFLLWCAPVNSHTEWSAVWKAFCKIAVFQDFIVVCFSKFVMRCFGPSHSMLFAIPQHLSTLHA